MARRKRASTQTSITSQAVKPSQKRVRLLLKKSQDPASESDGSSDAPATEEAVRALLDLPEGAKDDSSEDSDISRSAAVGGQEEDSDVGEIPGLSSEIGEVDELDQGVSTYFSYR